MGSIVEKFEGGGGRIIHTLRRAQSCSVCGRSNATIRCDFSAPGNKSGTCDKWLCRSCAVPRGPNIDWCPDHLTARNDAA